MSLLSLSMNNWINDGVNGHDDFMLQVGGVKRRKAPSLVYRDGDAYLLVHSAW